MMLFTLTLKSNHMMIKTFPEADYSNEEFCFLSDDFSRHYRYMWMHVNSASYSCIFLYSPPFFSRFVDTGEVDRWDLNLKLALTNLKKLKLVRLPRKWVRTGNKLWLNRSVFL